MSMRMARTCRFVARLFFATYLVLSLSHVSSSQSSEADGTTEPSVTTGNKDASDPSAEDDKNGPSDAERIGEIKESLEQDQKQLLALEQEIDNPESEYALAEKEFRSIKEAVDQANEKLEAARKANDESAITSLDHELASLETQRKLAEDRFDLAIEDRKTLREQRQTLKKKIEHDQAALAAITGEDLDKKSDEIDQQADSNAGRTSHSKNEHPSSSHEKGGHADEKDSAHGGSEHSSNASEGNDEKEPDEEHSEELTKAREEAEEKDKEADAAQEETRSIAARLADIQKLVTQEQKELDLARKKVELASAAQMTLSQELARRTAEEADAKELAGLRASIASASNRLIKARAEVAEISERLNDHRAELSSLQAEHIVALHEAEKKRQEANDAEQRIAAIRNPFTLRNILQWTIEHGPRILGIVVECSCSIGLHPFLRCDPYDSLQQVPDEVPRWSEKTAPRRWSAFFRMHRRLGFSSPEP